MIDTKTQRHRGTDSGQRGKARGKQTNVCHSLNLIKTENNLKRGYSTALLVFTFSKVISGLIAKSENNYHH